MDKKVLHPSEREQIMPVCAPIVTANISCHANCRVTGQELTTTRVRKYPTTALLGE